MEPIPPTDLRAWLELAREKSLELKIELANGTLKQGRLVGCLEDFVMLSPGVGGRDVRIVAIAHIAAVEVSG